MRAFKLLFCKNPIHCKNFSSHIFSEYFYCYILYFILAGEEGGSEEGDVVSDDDDSGSGTSASSSSDGDGEEDDDEDTPENSGTDDVQIIESV